MKNLIWRYENEVRMRKKNLETKMQVDAAVNGKESEMLMLMDTMIDNLKEKLPEEEEKSNE